MKKKEKKSSLKFVSRNQNAICSSCFNYSLCKSQEDRSSWFTKRKVKDKKCKHIELQSEDTRQTKAPKFKYDGHQLYCKLNQTAVIKPNATRCQACQTELQNISKSAKLTKHGKSKLSMPN